jgi:dipeptidyl aminopeptidase/acylaminoacyl peptidase
MRFPVILFAAFVTTPALAQQAPRALTAADYARAEQFMGYNANPLVFHGAARPAWLAGDRFWYRNAIPEGFEFVLVDPARKTRARAFDHVKLAAGLSAAAGDTTFDALHLPFTTFDFSADGKAITFDAARRHWTCDATTYLCTGTALVGRGAGGGRGGRGGRGGGGRGAGAPPLAVSPDSTKGVFIRDHNLWLRDIATRQETQLTTDGVPDFGYATDNAGWTTSNRAVVQWSPDSKKIATFQQDQRGVGEMYLVQTKVGHPVLSAWKYPLPGDSVVTMVQRVIIDLAGPKVIRLQMPPDQHRSSDCDDIACRGGGWDDVQWTPDGSKLYFLSTSRDHRHEWLRVADAATGAVKDIMEEASPDFFESGFNHINWKILPATNELIWHSARTDWGHLYLYDLTTGKLKNPITSGTWALLQVLKVDEATRTVFFNAAGKEAGDPYFRHAYSVKLDGTRLTALTPDSADHDVAFAPSGKYLVDVYSTPQAPPVSVLRDLGGKVGVALEKADISRLLATGWTPPTSFTVKARDGKTDLYGLLYRPTSFDSTKKYPIINYIYPGPQTGSVGSRSFSAARGDHRALAELGFVVFQLDAMGTPMRSHSFQGAYYGNMGDNGLLDQVAGMKQLAQRYAWIDLDKTGIWGHSGGGFATAAAMFRFPDFFKVGISEAGNHDNAVYEDDWGEKWTGLLVRTSDSTTSYDAQSNEAVAKNLKGKLLLAHGLMDNNVPPYNTLLVVDSLIKYNKDFDLIVLPDRPHGFGGDPYMVRRRWDYFVKNLMGAEPPHEYEMRPPAPAR